MELLDGSDVLCTWIRCAKGTMLRPNCSNILKWKWNLTPTLLAFGHEDGEVLWSKGGTLLNGFHVLKKGPQRGPSPSAMGGHGQMMALCGPGTEFK